MFARYRKITRLKNNVMLIVRKTLQYPGTPRPGKETEAESPTTVNPPGIARRRLESQLPSGKGKGKVEKTGKGKESRNTALRDNSTQETEVEALVRHCQTNMGTIMVQTAAEDTITTCNQWRQRSAAHEPASQRTQSPRLQSPLGVNSLPSVAPDSNKVLHAWSPSRCPKANGALIQQTFEERQSCRQCSSRVTTRIAGLSRLRRAGSRSTGRSSRRRFWKKSPKTLEYGSITGMGLTFQGTTLLDPHLYTPY